MLLLKKKRRKKRPKRIGFYIVYSGEIACISSVCTTHILRWPLSTFHYDKLQVTCRFGNKKWNIMWRHFQDKLFWFFFVLYFRFDGGLYMKRNYFFTESACSHRIFYSYSFYFFIFFLRDMRDCIWSLANHFQYGILRCVAILSVFSIYTKKVWKKHEWNTKRHRCEYCKYRIFSGWTSSIVIIYNLCPCKMRHIRVQSISNTKAWL